MLIAKVIICVVSFLVGLVIMQGFDFVVAKIKEVLKHEKKDN